MVENKTNSKRKTSGNNSRMTINVNGTDYPCYPTMGAAIGFKDQTGRDIEKMKGTSDFAIYIYCCARSASRREKKDFNLSLEEFCDGVLIEDLNKLQSASTGESETEDGKKN